MAVTEETKGGQEEGAPLLKEEAAMYKGEKEPGAKDAPAHGVPVGLLVSGHPVDAVPAQTQPRRRWSTGLFDCLYSSPEHHGNDVEVCLTGWLCPCVLFGTIRDRLNPEPYQFAGNCCLYSGFYLLGQAILKGNVLAPIVTYPNRTEIRQRFNIEGDYSSSECLTGCCGMPSEETRELVEARCDCCVHYFCHSCALCQEAREVRRCIPHHPPVAAPVAPLVAPSVPTMV